jgi:hypothetical protein
MDTLTPNHFHRVKVLVGWYLGISLATLAAIVALRHDAAAVNTAVWVRGTIVAASALLMTVVASRAGKGSRSAYRRLRILSAVMVAAIAAVLALPGTFPLWLKAEQVVCGLLLVAVIATVNSKRLRSAFR